MNVGDKVIFTGHKYVLAQYFNYAEKFKDNILIVERVRECPCENHYSDTLKFEGIEGNYRASFFTKVEDVHNRTN